MTTKFLKGILVSLFVSVLLVSCEKTTNEISQPEQVTPPSGTLTVLGKKLPNPYEPEIVKRAWQNVSITRPELIKDLNMDFKPTHLYIKFSPKDFNELVQLKNIYGHELDNIPAFYEYKTMGDYYRDPLAKDGQPTFQYAVINVDEKIPDVVEYEILEQLILLDYSEKDAFYTKYGEDIITRLQDECYRISGLIDFMYSNGNSARSNLLWTPSGHIKFKDENDYSTGCNNAVAAVGATVKFLDPLYIPKIQSVETGSDGKFKAKRKVAGKVKYRVKFKGLESTSSNISNTPYKIIFCDGSIVSF